MTIRWADAAQVEDAAESWSESQLHCRTYNHTWRPLSVTHRPGVYTVTQRCSRCRNVRKQDIDDYGYPLTAWRHEYREGYLLEDVGRIGMDGRAVLRLAVLKTLTVIEVEDEEADDA